MDITLVLVLIDRDTKYKACNMLIGVHSEARKGKSIIEPTKEYLYSHLTNDMQTRLKGEQQGYTH